jgi:hypothetical protein
MLIHWFRKLLLAWFWSWTETNPALKHCRFSHEDGSGNIKEQRGSISLSHRTGLNNSFYTQKLLNLFVKSMWQFGISLAFIWNCKQGCREVVSNLKLVMVTTVYHREPKNNTCQISWGLVFKNLAGKIHLCIYLCSYWVLLITLPSNENLSGTEVFSNLFWETWPEPGTQMTIF